MLDASFFVPAWVAEHYPDAVKAIVAGGHELGCHGDVHERVTDLDADREEKVLRRSVEVLTKLGGRTPIGYRAPAFSTERLDMPGYRAPAWQLSERTLGLLRRHGFAYSSNMMDRLEPYLHEALAGTSLVEIPVSWALDDAPYFLFTGQRALQAPGPVLQGWITEFDGICEVGGIANFTFHPQIIGRPSRFACLRELVDHVKRTPRVWVARLDEVAALWQQGG